MKYGIFLAIVAVFGCQPKTKVVDKAPQPVEKEVKKMPEKPPIKEILLSETGVGRLGASSTFEIKTIQEAFGGYTVSESEGSMEGTTYKIFLVKEKEEVILEISSDDEKMITEILVKSAKVNNEVGQRVGAIFKDVFPDKDKADCILGADDLGETYMCTIPKVKNVRYRFTSNEKGIYTPDENWILTSLEWRRPIPQRQPSSN